MAPIVIAPTWHYKKYFLQIPWASINLGTVFNRDILRRQGNHLGSPLYMVNLRIIADQIKGVYR